MDAPKRFMWAGECGMLPTSTGVWVKYEDYLALKREQDELLTGLGVAQKHIESVDGELKRQDIEVKRLRADAAKAARRK